MTDRYSRRFTVRGIDEDGDVQCFATDDQESAQSVWEQMEEDLAGVEFVDREATAYG